MKKKTGAWLLSLVLLSLMPASAMATAGQSKCGGLAPSGTSKGGAAFDDDLPADQDVFSFCAFGYPPHCWVGVNPIAGTWKTTCSYFNPKWTKKYETICPGGVKPGTWKSPGKMPFDYKGKPGAPDGLEECQHLMEGF